MKKSMRSLVSAVLAVSMTMAMTACGGGSSATTAAAPETTTAKLSCEGERQIIDKAGTAGRLKKGTEHDKHDDNRRGDLNGRTENTIQIDRQILEQRSKLILLVPQCPRQHVPEARIEEEQNRQRRHDIAETASGPLQNNDEQQRTGNHRPLSGNTQIVRQMIVLILAHPDRSPERPDHHKINDTAEETKSGISGKAILKYMLVERLTEQQYGKRKCDMDAALRYHIQLPEYSQDVKQ